jgi:hypothetical protein
VGPGTTAAWRATVAGQSRPAAPCARIIRTEFQLERVDLRGGGDSYEIAVLFRWAGQTDLFGMRFDIPPDDDDFGAPDAYISVHVQENLLASGYGLANAAREHADGVTWLRWPRA